MAVLKCKMCGGDIQAKDGVAYGTCESCGTTSTLPKVSDERKANLYNRANHFRRQNDFDKAVQAYENILNEDNADAEAHWGIVLSRYGIEYVEDPSSHERIPTCHRVQSESILKDVDYLETLQHAPDEYTKSLYEGEAKKISEIQKGILVISNKEQPYDVFICYKETTDGGSRTKDSTIAQDIYYELTKDGYKVFFAKITLEDKLGQQYEPYIFNALNSAKVMLVIGTKKEHFEAVWVKNEWSRFLAIMKKDRSRLLIPCYRDMDAYDIPDELSNLQSQDMSKVGFIQDILRGVKKILDASKSDKKTSSATVGASSAAPGVESLMKRGKLFLEDSDWKQANEYFDKVLDIDPEYAPAYVGKLCAELEVRQEELLGDNKEPISEHNYFQKAVRFADAVTRAKLEGYNKIIQERIEEEKRKEQEKERMERERINKKLEPLRSYKSLIATKKDETEKEDAELRKKHEQDMKRWQEDVSRRQEQSKVWQSQKRCPHCGGKIGLFNKICKVCKKESSTPLDMPTQPKAPDYNIPKFNISSVLQSIRVSFGNYNWLVLDIQNNKALLLSENSIGKRPYHSPSSCNVTWEKCDLKRYLNGNFLQGFNVAEKAMIDNGEVFLLSVDEVNKYFGAKGNEKNPNLIGDIGNWWLRSSEAVDQGLLATNRYYTFASYVSADRNRDGSYKREEVGSSWIDVRPALWLKIS